MTQELVRNSRGKRAISVGATEVLLYGIYCCIVCNVNMVLRALGKTGFTKCVFLV